MFSCPDCSAIKTAKRAYERIRTLLISVGSVRSRDESAVAVGIQNFSQQPFPGWSIRFLRSPIGTNQPKNHRNRSMRSRLEAIQVSSMLPRSPDVTRFGGREGVAKDESSACASPWDFGIGPSLEWPILERRSRALVDQDGDVTAAFRLVRRLHPLRTR